MKAEYRSIIQKVQVNVPFRMLYETHVDRVVDYGLNPEIGFDADALDTYGPDEYKAIARRLHPYNPRITFHGPFMDLSPGSPDTAIRAVTRKRLEQTLRAVPIFRPQTVVCHAGYEYDRYDTMADRWLAYSLDLWGWFAQALAEEGVRLMLENVYEWTPHCLVPLFEGLRACDVGFCFDPGHGLSFSRTATAEWLDVLGVYLGQVHLHDNHGDKDAHLAMGQGCIDFDVVFRYLKHHAAHRPVWITLEPHAEEVLWGSLEYLHQAGFAGFG